MFATSEVCSEVGTVGHEPVEWQASLFAMSEPRIDAGFSTLHRYELTGHSWVDYQANWLGGADELFRALLSEVPWRRRRVVMYDRLLPEPRLTSVWSTSSAAPFPLPIFSEARGLLAARYDRNFDSLGSNYYRDGRDSVAWHGDRLPGDPEEPVVAIVSVGSRRPFLLRPTGGGASMRFELGEGDLLVMGGQSQTTWQHSVPKVAACGPRISVTYRHGGQTVL